MCNVLSLRNLISGVVVATILTAPALAADPTGLWQTPVHGGQVEISKCGTNLCGRIVASNNLNADPDLKDVNNSNASLRSRRIKGLAILTGFTGGPEQWTGGTVYNTEDGKTYSGSITLVGDNTLKLTGCVVAPLCKTQTWTRLR